jgi:dephospho-CoA kinase
MLKVGITGNIGSGKTTICKVFEVLGIPVFYADEQGKAVMTQDEVLIAGVKQAFGQEAYFADGTLNRKYIANIVFNNTNELERLNALVHPAVFRAFDEWVLKHPTAPYVIKESAILFESGSFKLCNRSLLVAAPFEMRMQRVIGRDGITLDEAERRDARQFAEDKKRDLADDVIMNDDAQLVIPQVLALHNKYLALAK